MKDLYIKCEENEGQALVVNSEYNCVSIMLPWDGCTRVEYVVAIPDGDLEAFKEAVAKMR